MLIHADADAFFASVEQRDDSSLVDLPFVVAHQVVACASYAARRLGVRSGLPLGQALRICPQVRVVEPRYAVYEETSAELFALFRDVTIWVEAGSMEEAFLDVEILGLDAVSAAADLRRRARTELGLPVSMGVGTTKLMAKVASRRAKPDGLVVISRTEDRAVRRALKLDQVWGLGAHKVTLLAAAGLHTVADLEGREIRELATIVGTMQARRLAGVAAGLDDATIKTPGPRKSAGASRTLPHATRSRTAIEATFTTLVDAALGRLPPRVEVSRIDVGVRFDDGDDLTNTVTPQTALEPGDQVQTAAHELLQSTAYDDDGRGVRFLSVSLSCRPLTTDRDQLTLPL